MHADGLDIFHVLVYKNPTNFRGLRINKYDGFIKIVAIKNGNCNLSVVNFLSKIFLLRLQKVWDRRVELFNKRGGGGVKKTPKSSQQNGILKIINGQKHKRVQRGSLPDIP